MADLRIDLAAEFLGRKAFKEADTAVNKLQKSTVNLGRTLGIALSATAIAAYGKASVRAFANAEAQQQRLVQLLKVGVSATDSQIESLNKQADALERVGVVSAGNVTQVQSQLATFNLQARTIATLTPAILDYVTAEKGAAASTEEFRSATNGLAQALNGNFTSLTRVGFVIDESTRKLIKNGTEAERTNAIVQVLDSTYKGFNASLRDTPVGSLQILTNAADAAKESIGEGLVNALARIGGGKESSDAVIMIERLAKAFVFSTDVISTGIGALVKVYKKLDFLTSFGGVTGGSGTIAQYAEKVKEQLRQFENPRSASPAGTALRMRKEREQQALAAKREKERLALLKKQEQVQKKLTAERKRQAAIDKLSTVFDLDKIGLFAALQGKLSRGRRKIELMAQLALLSGNVKVAEELTQKVLKAQDASGDLARFLAALPNARNPFEYLDAYLDKLAAKAAKVLVTAPAQTISPQAQAIVSQIDAATSQALAAAAAADAEANRISSINKVLGTLPSASGVPIGQPFSPGFSAGGNNTPGASFELKITGEGDITNAIAKGLQNQSLSTGTTTTINRSGGFL
jgi:hypothetical protein